MTVKDLESAIAKLSPGEFAELAEWLDEFRARVWEERIASDARAGRLDNVIREAEDEFRAGRCTPL